MSGGAPKPRPGAAGAPGKHGTPPGLVDRLRARAAATREWMRWAVAHREPAARLHAHHQFQQRHMLSPPIRVDLAATPEQTARLTARIEASWVAFGATEPHWSVLSVPQFRSDRIGETLESFYASGDHAVARVRAALARAGADLDTAEEVLDYGCGVGRVSAAFARAGHRVHGVDISANHLALAREHCAAHGLDRVALHRIARLAEIDDLPAADLFFSVIVLQHNPPPLIAEILHRALARVRPGGFAYFQVPTYRTGYAYDLEADLAGAPEGTMELHILPQAALFAILDEAGFVPLEFRPNNAVAAAAVESHAVLARRRPDRPASGSSQPATGDSHG